MKLMSWPFVLVSIWYASHAILSAMATHTTFMSVTTSSLFVMKNGTVKQREMYESSFPQKRAELETGKPRYPTAYTVETSETKMKRMRNCM